MDTIPTTDAIEVDPRETLPPSVDSRESRDPAHVRALAAVMREKGFLGTILVRAVGGRHEVVWGETRRQAAVAAGLARIPARVIEGELSESDVLLLQLDENQHHRTLTAVEHFRALQRLKRLNNWTNAELARRRNCAPSEVTKALAVLDGYPEDLWPLIGDGDFAVPASTAYQLARLGDETAIRELTDQVVRGLLTRDAAEEEVAKRLGKRPRSPKAVRARTRGGLSAMLPGGLTPEAVLVELGLLTDAVRKAARHGFPLSSVPGLLKGNPERES